MSISPSDIAALVVASSFAAGLNLYATILVLGVLARTHVALLPPGLDVLSHTWVLAICAVLFAAEFVADKIPVLDLLWNALHTAVRIPAAALLAWQASSQLSPGLQIAAAAIGAAIAAVAHSSKIAARAAVTPSPEPVTNAALSIAEDAGAIGLTWLATHHPFAAAGIVAVVLLLSALLARTLYRAGRRSIARLRSSTHRGATPALLP